MSGFAPRLTINDPRCPQRSQSLRYTLPKTNSSPLKIGHPPKGNDRIPTIHFQVRLLLVSGRVHLLQLKVNGLRLPKASKFYIFQVTSRLKFPIKRNDVHFGSQLGCIYRTHFKHTTSKHLDIEHKTTIPIFRIY